MIVIMMMIMMSVYMFSFRLSAAAVRFHKQPVIRSR